MKKKILQQMIPPGIDMGRELKYMTAGLAAALIYSFSFIIRYISARNDLYYYDYRNEERILMTDAVITEFEVLADGPFAGFGVFLLLLLMISIYHYVYHWQGSKSIWLMKRLPDRMELHRRCLTVPFLAAVISVLTAAVLLLIYYGVYVMCTPEICLPPGIV